MAVFATACAEGLSDQSVQTDEESSAEEGKHMHEDASQADRGDGHGAIRQAADHHRVNNGHAHPAQFGEHQRNGQPQSGPDLRAKCLQSNHGGTAREKSVRGDEKRCKLSPPMPADFMLIGRGNSPRVLDLQTH